MNITATIAKNLNKLRTERNLSMGQLAQISGISKVILSQIEKGDSNPTINTIWKIAAGLNVPYTMLLEQSEPQALVVRKKDAIAQTSEDKQYRHYCFYQSSPSRNFELFLMELEAGGHYLSQGHAGHSEEYLLVIQGELKVEVCEKKFSLQLNDAITFDATAPHIYRNEGIEQVKALIINYYPH